ncbi:MAG: hypothetical protein RQ875_08295, partial [Vicingaceae bacterium]|nr:hypothetical protein [Vicingaceae bacterium]
LAVIIITLSLVSCNIFLKEEEDIEGVVVELGQYQLKLQEIENLSLKDITKEDSITIVNNFIENWIKEKLVLQKAELNLDQNQQDFKKQLEEYRSTLLIYTYEKELIKQKLDTFVADVEIKAYYDRNPENFKLINDIVKVKFMKVPINAPRIKKVKKIFSSTDQKHQQEVKEYAHQYAEKFYFNEDEWIEVNDLKKELPLTVSYQIIENQSIAIEDSLAIYFLKTNEYLKRGDLAPLSFETENIKNIIINKRKLNVLKKLKHDLYQQAISSNKVKFHIDNKEENKITN